MYQTRRRVAYQPHGFLQYNIDAGCKILENVKNLHFAYKNRHNQGFLDHSEPNSSPNFCLTQVEFST